MFETIVGELPGFVAPTRPGESIVAAALINQQSGVIYIGRCHADILDNLLAQKRLKFKDVSFGGATFSVKGYDQGFLTSKNRFVDREVGAHLGVACGQAHPERGYSSADYL
jgi:hypothetical protein